LGTVKKKKPEMTDGRRAGRRAGRVSETKSPPPLAQGLDLPLGLITGGEPKGAKTKGPQKVGFLSRFGHK